jgi:hypothetical protein
MFRLITTVQARDCAPVHPRLDNADDADVAPDAQELVEPVSEEPVGYGYGEWASGPFPAAVPHHLERAPFAGRGPRGYRRSDSRIYEDVCDRLTDDSHVDASAIEVTVRDNEVALRGSVSTREMRRRAEDVALAVAGVRHVTNDLRVGALRDRERDASS